MRSVFTFFKSKWGLALISLLLLICMLSGCVKPTLGTTDTTADSETVVGEGDSATTGEDTTTAEEETGWKQNMGKFNEGKVDYKKVVETEIHETYPEEDIGKLMSPGQNGVSTLLHSDFSDGDAGIGGKVSCSKEQTTVEDGRLILPYNIGWTTWTPNATMDLNNNLQTQFSFKWELRPSANGHIWESAIVGAYVKSPGSICDKPGSGLWFAFHNDNDRITIYHPDKEYWPTGWTTINLEEGLLDGTHKVDILCLPDYTTYVYVTPSGSNEARCVVTVKFEDGKIRAYNEEQQMVQESDCGKNSLGEYFSFFPHMGGAAIDEVALLAGSKGNVVENVSITATPVGDNTLGLDITDKTGLVSICYSVWFDAILGSETNKVENWYNISEILAGEAEWGPENAFHYWARPAEGYYRSSDKTVIRKHMTQLYTAGVDFIIIDLTNANNGYIGTNAWTSYIQKPMDAICDTIMEMRTEGLGTPYVVFWVGDNDGALYREIYSKYHDIEKWKDCFVYWDGKPFMLTTHTQPSDFPCSDLLTVRSMWGLLSPGGYSSGQWSFLQPDNTGIVAYDKNGSPEQVSVAVASQETYMSDRKTAHGREGGLTWYKQWYRAFEVKPKIVTLTWWNEWTAQRLKISERVYHFTDNYNQNYSRDIEPMEGGHGDQYYQWMIKYISAYKGGYECPVLIEKGYEKQLDLWYREIGVPKK